MENVMESQKNIIQYYENARESFVAKMRSEDDERSNLKFKIAAFVMNELSNATPKWFKNHFLTYIAKNDGDAGVMDENVIQVENAFYDAIADYLIKMESEVDYVKKMLAPNAEDSDKREFWESIVFDAFLIVGIYFTPSLVSSLNPDNQKVEGTTERDVHSGYISCHASAYGRSMAFR